MRGMATEPEGKPVSHEGNGVMGADYGIRAAHALDRLIGGPHRDKVVARAFGVSVRMAKYLRSGKHWTTERLSQASRLWGVDFDRLLSAPNASYIQAEIAD